MQPCCLQFFRKKLTVLIFLFSASYYGANGCIDLQTWCAGNKNFCDNDVMKLNCPETCGTCLPAECRLQCKHNCTVPTDGPIQCTCYEGYRLKADGKSCEDIDECAENLLTCKTGEACQNYLGSAKCASDMCSPFNSQDYVLSTTYEDTCCHQSRNPQCGANNLPNVGKIIGGVDARIEFWPWQALLVLGSTEKCGGSLIDDIWLISAAHCFDNYPVNRIAEFNVTVLLGLNETTSFTGISVQPRRIVEVIIADGYVFPNNDIALVRLDRPIVRSEFVKPVCLPNGEVPPVGVKCFVTGFGTTHPDTTALPKHLQQANVSIVDDEVCKEAYKDFQHPMDPTRMRCAGFPEGGIDACRGDSGGPLVCQRCNSCEWFLAGVTSYGRGCAQSNAYGVYTRVEYYENWIASKISSVDVSNKTCEPTRWNEWSQWSTCTERCEGTQSRSRECINGIPGIPGCTGEINEKRPCTAQNQREWTTWSECSASCGGGKQTRTRHCMPKGPKTRTQRRDCNAQTCVNWSDWSNWSPCPNPCASDQRLRTRTCIGGNAGDVGCQGPLSETGTCTPDPSCTEFGAWSSWSSCSKTCGGGLRTSSRECNGAIWGLSCTGSASRSESCATDRCGQWSDWTLWGACDKSCGDGVQRRSRTCIGGNDCEGENIERRSCNLRSCVEWTAWSEWSSCSTTCGNGIRTRSRDCGTGNVNAGQCQGSASQEEQCFLAVCEAAPTCSDDCLLYVNSGYCSPQYKLWFTASCGEGCCSPTFCKNSWADCDKYRDDYCQTNQNFARVCLRKCGYCS